MSVPPPAPTLAGGQEPTWGPCPGRPGAARAMVWAGMGQGGSAACLRAAGPAPGSCLKNALSPWFVRPVGPGAHHPHRHCREPAPPLRGASRADGTSAGTYWHCIREREGFWQGPGLLPGTSHKTSIIIMTLFNKVLVGRRARRLLCLFSFTSPRVPSAGSLKPPRWGGSGLVPLPQLPVAGPPPEGGERGRAEAATDASAGAGEVRRGSRMCRSSTFPFCDPACCGGQSRPQRCLPSPCQEQLPQASTVTGPRGQTPVVGAQLTALFKAGEGWPMVVRGYVLCSVLVTADASAGPHPLQRAPGTSTPRSAGSSPVSFEAPSCCRPGAALPASVLVPGSLPRRAPARGGSSARACSGLAFALP